VKSPRSFLHLTFAGLIALGVGCDEGTLVVVHADAEATARAGATSVVATVIGPDGMREESYASSDIPLRLALEPRGGDASRRYEIVLELRDEADSVLGRQRALSGYVDGEERELRLLFDDACVGVICGDGESCYEGACVDACVEPTVPGAVSRSEFEPCSVPSDGGLPDAPACDDAAPPSCVDGDIERCEGGTVVTEACGLDCAAGETACPQILPSNVGDLVAMDVSSRDVVVPAGQHWVVDTTDMSLRAFDGDPDGAELSPDLSDVELRAVVTDPAEGREVGVVAVASLHVESGATFEGIGSRPLVILAATDVQIDGTLTVASSGDRVGAGGQPGGTPGPGNGEGAGADGSSDTTEFVFSGGGGGGYGTAGGAGGEGYDEATSRDGGDGGDPYGAPSLVPLLAGSGGGSGGGGTFRAQHGGPGGGAIQVSAGRSITVGASGVVDASGGGGLQGQTGTTAGGGGGGGSGGSLMLEAPDVELAGAVGSNGGGGSAGGGPCDDIRGPLGTDGSATMAPALGGVPTTCRGRGGDGNDPMGATTDGERNRDGGGGGGGSGRVRINTEVILPPEDYPTVLPDASSGAFSTGRVERAS
jgi:hypothetical protein